jgi:hypothetical protein
MIPGDPIGLKAIQFLMHGATQSNLSSFHTAGTISLSSLTPTIQQLLDVSKNPICRTIIHHKDSLPAWKIVNKSLWSFVKSINIIDDFEEDDWYKIGREMEIIRLVYEDTLVFRVMFDYDRLRTMDLSLETIAHYFRHYSIARSPDIIGIIDIHADDINTIIDAIGLLRSINFGIENINAIRNSVCEGSNLSQLFALDEVDSTRTISNHIIDVYNTLGLEAARDVLHEELSRYISDEYASVIADFMTREGTLDSFVKGKKFDQDKGILLSMALERPSNDIQTLAYKPIHDNLNNSYSRLMVGKNPRVGTGYVTTEI